MSSLGPEVIGIEKNKRYAVQSIGGCAACISRMHHIKVTPSETPTQEFLGTPFFGIGGNGGHAEYAVVDEQFLVPVVSGYPNVLLGINKPL